MINRNDLPLVSLHSMNTTHFDEIAIINLLLVQIDTKVNYETLSLTLEKLIEHIYQHFSSEEKLMKDTQYPSFNMHKADHDKVLNQARYAEMEWRNKKDVNLLNEYIREEFIPWLDQHIKAMDTPMADFISQF
ncbi:MAG: hemerythrin family protein [Campylobacterota bacterium]|nr:hemerythrin family protein [Campylobacterota bacterium]